MSHSSALNTIMEAYSEHQSESKLINDLKGLCGNDDGNSDDEDINNSKPNEIEQVSI